MPTIPDFRPSESLAVALAHEHTAPHRTESASALEDRRFSALSHALRNPLNTMAAAIEVLNRVDAQAALAARAREIISQQVRVMARLLDGQGKAAPMTGAALEPPPECLELAGVTRAAMALAQGAAASKRLSFSSSLAPVWVDADARYAQQLIGTLLAEAIQQASPGSEVRIELSADAQDAVLRLRHARARTGLAPAGDPDRSTRRHPALALAACLVELRGGSFSMNNDADGGELAIGFRVGTDPGPPAHAVVA